MKKNERKKPGPKSYSAFQAQRDLHAIDELYERGDGKIITPAVRDKLKEAVYRRIAETVGE